MIRYRFSQFTLSPQQRLLLRDGQEVPLIPRYFDLLLMLVERRHEAVHRNEIFERVWTDVNVSDSALSQAVRIIRRTLDDDSKEPRYIRTVSRHGYRFVFPEVVEEHDDAPAAVRVGTPTMLEAGAREPAWLAAGSGGAMAGVAAGGLGGLLLAIAPESQAPIALAPVLAGLGGACGAVGGAGVGAGLSFAHRITQVPHAAALIAGTSIGGGMVGLTVQWLARWSFAGLLGLDLAVGGGLEGLVIGAAAGAALTLDVGNRRARLVVAAVFCGLAGLALTLTGHPLVGGTIHAMANASDGSLATLAPLGRLVGEPDFGPVSRALIAFGEGAAFGLGLAYGLARSRESHTSLNAG